MSEAFLILGVSGEAAALKRVNDALAADNERLLAALGNLILDCQRGPGFTVSKPYRKTITDAQAAIRSCSAQSLAAHDAALLREVADREFNPEQSAEERWAHGVLHGNADRIEKEAQRG